MAKENILVFEKFERTKFPVLMCLFGFSGCGKTLSAIKIAKGMGGNICFLDTETGRGRVYAKSGAGFTYTEMTPPFTPERYTAAIQQIEAAGFDTLVIDSGSHEWDGLGGMLEIAESRRTASGAPVKGLGKWSVKSRHKTFMNTMMAGKMNIIICLRAKDHFIEKIDRNGDKTIVNEGFVPLQERNFKYDMMIQLPMPEGGQGRFLLDRERGFKCPEDLLPYFREGEQITEAIGEAVAKWIAGGLDRDEILRQMRLEAEEAAGAGADAFRTWWAARSKDQRDKLRPYLQNLESIAKEADSERVVDEGDPTPQPAQTRSTGQKSDISSLVGVQPKAETVEDAALADWRILLDEIRPELEKCKNPAQFGQFMADNAKKVLSFNSAPETIRAEFDALVAKAVRGGKA